MTININILTLLKGIDYMQPIINANQKINYRLDIDDSSEWISVTPCEMARNAFFYVQEAGHFYCGPDYFTERERLDSFLIKCTLSGSGRIEYRGKTYDVGRGDVFFISCEEYQHYRTANESWEHIWVHINGAGCMNYFRQFYENNGSCVVRLPRFEEVSEPINKIMNLYRIGGVYADIIASKLISDIFAEIMIAATGVNDNAARLPRPIQLAVDLIERDYQENVTLEYLAGKVSLNRQYFQKLFKKYTKMSPYMFLTTIRVNRAKELLRFSDMSIEEIAAEVGLNSAGHFIQIFKKMTDTTPNAYRKMWNAKR
ncbi:MAG: AraC family transcriptional regulator [Oscillospiraceae bacterium]|nr:AraC family transcriptional regulator [Oscillospiraceae bacterium]